MADNSMPEALFYHLERQPLERVLPTLLEKSLERGWRVIVQLGDEERLEALDSHLWTYRDDSFLAHGTAKDGHPILQPIYLTTKGENPNGANIRFYVHGASLEEADGYERLVFLFDGHDEGAVQQARAHWKLLRDQGCTVTYWQQDEQGRWVQKA